MSDRLKDFLVGIGFELDKPSQAKAEAAVKDTEAKITKASADASARRSRSDAEEATARAKRRQKAVKDEEEHQSRLLKGIQSFAVKSAGFAAAAFATIEAGALAVVAATDRAAKGVERLSYASGRAGASATKMTGFGYAAEQNGSTRAEAEGQLQQFGLNLKRNGSGYESALRRLHVRIREANGAMRDSVDIATDLGDALRKISGQGRYGYANAENNARIFGFEGDTFRAMMNPNFRARENEYNRDRKRIGADPDAAAKSGTAFEQSMRHLEQVLGSIGTKIDTVLFQKLKPLLDQLAQWFTANGDKIASIVSQLADSLVKLATALVEKLGGQDWDAILKHVGDVATAFGTMLGHIAGDAGLIVKLGILATALRALVMPPWLKAILGISAAADLAIPNAAKPGMTKRWDDSAGGLPGDLSNSDMDEADRRAGGGHKRSLFSRWRSFMGHSGIGKAQQNENSAAATDELRKAGYSDNAIAAVLGSMQTESSFNPRAHNGVAGGHTGAWQWDSTRWPKVKRWIEQQGGDPYDFRWQTRAWVAEHNARPGDAIYDNANTEEGGRILRNNPTLEGAIHGVQRSERFGIGEEGGRAGNARAWLPHLQPQRTPPMLRARPLPMPPSDPTHSPGLGADGKPVTLAPQHTSYRGDTNITHNPTFHIAGGDPDSNMRAARLSASRGQQDLLRNVEGALA